MHLRLSGPVVSGNTYLRCLSTVYIYIVDVADAWPTAPIGGPLGHGLKATRMAWPLTGGDRGCMAMAEIVDQAISTLAEDNGLQATVRA
jgi:hypothetical protein